MTDPTPPPLPPRPSTASAEPADPPTPGASVLVVVDELLKSPETVFHRIQSGQSLRVFLQLVLVVVASLGLYGLVAGVFSAGWQIVFAPMKITACVALGSLLCLPSLYIFTALSNVEVRLDQLLAHGASALALTGILLLALAPVLFVFTVSTSSLWFMGFLHLVVWLISGLLGGKLLMAVYNRLGDRRGYVVLWLMIYTTVLLQMSTTLRPILGPADRLIHTEKQFFLLHWMNMMLAGL